MHLCRQALRSLGDRDSAFHLSQRDLCGRDIDPRAVRREPALSACELYASAELDALSREVELDGRGLGVDTLDIGRNAS